VDSRVDMKVLCLSVYPEEGPSMRHRICGYREAWQRAGVALTIKPFLTHELFRRRRTFGLGAAIFKAAHMAFCTVRLIMRLATVHRYDVVLVHREVFPLGGAWFEKAIARLNPSTVYDMDDALWLPMPLLVDQRRLLWDAERVAETISTCTAVVAGNAFLRDYAGPRNALVKVIPTPYRDLGGRAAVDGAGRPPTIVWIGNVGNEEYLELVREPLERLARHHDFVLRVIGSREAASVRLAGVKIEALEWRDDREAEWLLECAVGIMPLHDRDYERGKCAFKLVQYFSAGMPVVASPIGMNCEVVREGDNGFLAATPDDWYRALDRLLSDGGLRREMGASGYRTYRSRFTIEANAALWLELFARLRRGYAWRRSLAEEAA
jgi:glycosyltransferase involved in cell wall biosynthesis